MRRIGIIGSVLAIVGLVAVAQPWQTAATEDARTIAIAVTIIDAPTQGESDRCGAFDFAADPGPEGRQVVVTDDGGTIVGTVPLYDIFDLQMSDDAWPGAIGADGFCHIRASVTVPDAAFYTFTVAGEYEWTVSRADLEARRWSMPLQFVYGS